MDKGIYDSNDVAKLNISIANHSGDAGKLQFIGVNIKPISGQAENNFSQRIPNTIVVDGHEDQQIAVTLKIPHDFKEGVYGVHLSYFENERKKDTLKTFFRLLKTPALSVYTIKKYDYSGLEVFALDGGMSAEYTVEKSAEILKGGISHSWKVNAPGSGPNPVYSTPDFLVRSVEETVDFYDELVGKNTSLETVIIGPGIPSVPYLSLACKAPVLPIHYLVSVNTVKEVQIMLDVATRKNYAAYSTVSHDPSVPSAVAWVKLLDLPQPYLDFISRHNIKNVILIGCTGTNDGETKGKKLSGSQVTRTTYSPGAIFIMYPGTSANDELTLQSKLRDLKDFSQPYGFERIADWESGISCVQIENFRRTIPDSVILTVITSDNLYDLYNFGTYSSIALMHKNKALFGEKEPLNGVTLNPYLIAHPLFEFRSGYVPLLYWQLVPVDSTVARLERMLARIKPYFKNKGDLTIRINSTRNFGGLESGEQIKLKLKKLGFRKIVDGNYRTDEVWDTGDGIVSSVERNAEEIVKHFSPSAFRAWYSRIVPLTPQELQQLSTEFPAPTFKIYSLK